MNSSKTSGQDGLPAELYKALYNTSLESFQTLLAIIWEKEEMPPDLCNAMIITLYKNEGLKTDCGNYWGISLPSIDGEILACIILNRLVSHTSKENLPEVQCSFHCNHNTIDMIFIIGQIK